MNTAHVSAFLVACVAASSLPSVSAIPQYGVPSSGSQGLGGLVQSLLPDLESFVPAIENVLSGDQNGSYQQGTTPCNDSTPTPTTAPQQGSDYPGNAPQQGTTPCDDSTPTPTTAPQQGSDYPGTAPQQGTTPCDDSTPTPTPSTAPQQGSDYGAGDASQTGDDCSDNSGSQTGYQNGTDVGNQTGYQNNTDIGSQTGSGNYGTASSLYSSLSNLNVNEASAGHHAVTGVVVMGSLTMASIVGALFM